MASPGHHQYGTQQTLLPGSVPQPYYASQPSMMYSYDDMQLFQQQRLSVPAQLQPGQLAAAGANPATLSSPYAVTPEGAKYPAALAALSQQQTGQLTATAANPATLSSPFAVSPEGAKYPGTIAALNQQQQIAAAAAAAGAGVYVPGNPGAYPYMMYPYAPAPAMAPGLPVQYGAMPFYQHPHANMPIAGGQVVLPQYQMQPKMVYANPSHPYYESPLPQDFKTGGQYHTANAQSKVAAPRVAVNSTPDIKTQIGKMLNPAQNPVGAVPSPYSPLIIPSQPPGAAHSSALQQQHHQMKPKY